MKPMDLRSTNLAGLPFYLFVSLLLAVAGIIAAADIWQMGNMGSAALCAVLFLMHIGAHWLSFNVVKSNWGWVGYYAV